MGETARRLGLSVDTVRALERSGELEAVRTPGGHRRFKPAVLDAYLDKRSRGGARHRQSARTPTLARPTRRRQHARLNDEEPDWLPPGEEWHEPQPVTPSTEAAAPAPKDEALEQLRDATSRFIEQNRLDDLRSYARSLIPWDASVSARSAVLEATASYVTAARFPASLSVWEARQAIKGKMEAILEPYNEAAARAAARKADEEQKARQLRSLIGHGKSRAFFATLRGKHDEAEEARAEVQDALEDEVEPDWSERDVDELVDETLEEWDEQSED